MFLNRLNLRNYSSASIIRIVSICRQPISAKNGLTYALFFDEVRHARRIFNSLLGVSSGDGTLRLMFDILLEPLVSASGKLLLAGDLNFHVNNLSEGNAYQFLDVF